MTVRMETHEDQPMLVNQKKKEHYNSCVSFFKEKFDLKTIDAHGFLLGARREIPTQVAKIFQSLGFPKTIFEKIAVSAVKEFCRILHNHLCSSNLIS